ncbi:MAG: fascin domain-containing protein [Nannocystaceae bacterium]
MKTTQILTLATTTLCALLGASTAAAAVVPQSALTPADSVYMGGLAYNDISSGQYVFTGTIYQGAPVYEHASNAMWKLYRRANGKWHVDFNDISEDWDGTIAHTTDPAQTPWDATWQGEAAATRTAAIYIASNTPQLTGMYTFEGMTHDGQPVYEPGAGKAGFVHYRANINRWIFSPHIGTGGYYSLSEAGCNEPGRCQSWTGKNAVMFEGAITAETTVALRTAHSKYVVAEGAGGGDVNANRTAIGAWEKLNLIELSTGEVLLRAPNGQFICPDNGGGGDVHATITQPTADCYLSMFTMSDNSVAFMTRTGNYLCGEVNGTFVANRTAIGSWEKFSLVDI